MRCCVARRSSPRAAPLVVDTGEHTGRSPLDKFVVHEPGSEDRIDWGSVNQPIEEDRFEGLRAKVVSFLDEQDVYVVDAFAGADPAHRLALRVVTYSPWHALFAKTLFIDPTEEEIAAARARGARAARAGRRGRSGDGRHALRHVRRASIPRAPRC